MFIFAVATCLVATVSSSATSPPINHYSSYPEHSPTWSVPTHPTWSASCPSGTSEPATYFSTWTGWGGNFYNNRWVAENSDVSISTIGSLAQHCKFTYKLGVSAPPTIQGDYAYYPTWSGLLVALNYKTCNVQWQLNVTEYLYDYAEPTAVQKIVDPVSRTSAQIDEDVIYIGTLLYALILAVDLGTGAVLASIQLNPHPLAILTMSPTVYKGKLFIGVSSEEEYATDVFPTYPCCSFAGNMVALTFDRGSTTFDVAWNISMLPSPPGNWSGAALWGSQPSIDVARSQVFIATGNVYTVPTEVSLCQNLSMTIPLVAQGLGQDPCLPSNVYQESVLALDLSTGLINWANQLSPIDAWTDACGETGLYNFPAKPINCPPNPGVDADFGMNPSFIPGGLGTPYGKDTVVVGQKNGILYALSAQAGRVFWSTVTSPDGNGGGLIWGVAVDGESVYFTAVNGGLDEWQLQPSNRTIGNSAFGAASLKDGTLLWETQAPQDAFSVVPPTVVNDVVFFGRSFENITGAGTGTVGGLVMIDKVTGEVVRDIGLETSFHGGIAVQDEYVMFGSGYSYDSVGEIGSFYVMKV